MDLQILFFTSIFTLFIFVFMAYKIVTKKSGSTPNLPPGPWKLPIIGNIHNLVGSLPHHRLRDLSSKYGPLMHLKLGEVSTIVVSSAEYAREVMKTHDINFASRPEILASKILSYDNLGMSFAPYGDYWRQLRKICTLQLLSSKRVQSFQPVREEELTNLIKLIGSKEGSPINLTKEVFSTISTITSRTAFGKKCKDQQKFISVIKETAEVAGGFDLGDLYPSVKWLQHISGLKPKLEKLHQQADMIMQNIINEHREAKSRSTEEKGEEGGEDLVDVLLKRDFLSDNSVKAMIMALIGNPKLLQALELNHRTRRQSFASDLIHFLALDVQCNIARLSKIYVHNLTQKIALPPKASAVAPKREATRTINAGADVEDGQWTDP